MRWLLRLVMAAGLSAALVGWVTDWFHPVYGLAPLLGVLIFRIGYGSLASFQAGADHIPSGDPQPVDLAAERTVYWCQGCGAEALLLVRGTPIPPRHCGERMTERLEVPREA